VLRVAKKPHYYWPGGAGDAYRAALRLVEQQLVVYMVEYSHINRGWLQAVVQQYSWSSNSHLLLLETGDLVWRDLNTLAFKCAAPHYKVTASGPCALRPAPLSVVQCPSPP
jgi:hypothetical protein